MQKSSSRTSSNNRTHKDTGRAERSRSHGRRVNSEWFRNFLSEMLAVEHGGIQLYQRALDELTHEGLRPKLEEFHRETGRHVELCEQLLDVAGGDEDAPSPGAEAAQHKAEGLLTAEVPDEMADINNIENLVLAETKDHWNWETLGALVGKLENGELRKLAGRAVREVRRQETNHLAWAQKALTQLAFEAAQQSGRTDEEKGADHEAQDREAEKFD